MPAIDSPAVIVARFLRASRYDLTLEAFISEAGLEPDAGSIEKDDLTIEKILEEKKVFDLSIRYEKLGAGDEEEGWSTPAPSHPSIISILPSASNILHVSVVSTTRSASAPQTLLATTADRNLHILNPDLSLVASLPGIQDSPILCVLSVGTTHFQIITASMSGLLAIYDGHADKILASRRDHKKYIVQLALWENEETELGRGRPAALLATASWDSTVNLHLLPRSPSGDYTGLPPPIHSLALPTLPECILFTQDPSTDLLYLIVTRKDSTSLHYYHVNPSLQEPHREHQQPTPMLTLVGTQSLAPYSTAWATFTPSSLALCPTDPALLAVGTSSLPHMKLLLVRLLFPCAPLPAHNGPNTASASLHLTQASQALASHETASREEAAILLHANTLAPQTPYSTPCVAWRPDGSGVWVNADDGIVRGVEVKTGKVVCVLGKRGHEAGVKVRSLWAGMVRGEEWVVSGGFDRRLVVWRVSGEGEGKGGQGGAEREG